jgi:hypothetical protein
MKLTYLYVKRLPNGLMYLGKTQAENPYTYVGSGTLWLKQIKNLGYTINDIETWILHKTYNKKDLSKTGIYYSRLFNVVKNNNWANLKDEEGDGGNTTGGKIIINNGNKQKSIRKQELHHYLNTEWKLGFTEDHINKIIESKKQNDGNKKSNKKMVETRKLNGSFKSAAIKAVKTKKLLGIFELAIEKMINTKKISGTGVLGGIKSAKTKKERCIPNGMQGKKHTEKTLAKLRGPKSQEHKEKLKGPKVKLPCKCCKKLVDSANMKRWHGENKCKIIT